MRVPTRWEWFWLLAIGPWMVIGLGVLHIAKHLNRFASLWCRFLMSVCPD